jgi:hypothetical protein
MAWVLNVMVGILRGRIGMGESVGHWVHALGRNYDSQF